MNKNRHALIILNTSYKDRDLNNLRITFEKSFEELKTVLEDPGLGDFEVNYLSNESSYNVKSKISNFFSKSGEEDLLLLYVVGYCLEEKDRLYLIFSNSLRSMLATTSISLDFINKEMSASKSNKQMVILDCHYIVVAHDVENVERKVELHDFFRGSEKIIVNASNVLRSISNLASKTVTHKCNFTSRFIKTVKSIDADQNDDNYVSLDELYTYLKGITVSVDEQTSMEMLHINRRRITIKDLIISSAAKKLAPRTTASTTSNVSQEMTQVSRRTGAPLQPASNKIKDEIAKVERQSEWKPQSYTNDALSPLKRDSRGDYHYEGRTQSRGINLKIVIPIIGGVAALSIIILAFSSLLNPEPLTDFSIPAELIPTAVQTPSNYIRQWHTRQPVSIAINTLDSVYTYGLEGVVVTDSNGNFITSWPSPSKPASFSDPWHGSIAIDSSDNVYVADAGNNRVQKFDSNGNFITMWGSRGNGEGQFESPRRIAIDYSDNVYVVDAGNNRVQKFDSNGNFITMWRLESIGEEFSLLSGVAVDSSDNVYVAETERSIQKFDSKGKLVETWDYLQQKERRDKYPDPIIGIAVDSSDDVYVADSENDRIQRFDSNGVLKSNWGSEGEGEGEFNSPQDIAFDSSGNIYVIDSWNERVQVFSQ